MSQFCFWVFRIFPKMAAFFKFIQYFATGNGLLDQQFIFHMVIALKFQKDDNALFDLERQWTKNRIVSEKTAIQK